MTKYCYAETMAETCSKLSQTLNELGEDKLSRFYSAASDGFTYRKKLLTVKEANKPASREMINDFHDLKKFYEEKETLVKANLDKEAKYQ